MFVDYLTLMIVNLAAGLVILAYYVFFHLDSDNKKLAPGLLVSGAIGTATGLHMIFTWPMPGSYNIAMGEMTVLYGVLFLAAGIAILRGWDLLGLAIYAAFAGLAAVVLGIRFMNMGISKHPTLSGLGFILAGAGGLLAYPIYLLKGNKVVRFAAAGVLVAAAVIWAVTGYGAYWDHMESFSQWAPGGPA